MLRKDKYDQIYRIGVYIYIYIYIASAGLDRALVQL